MSSPRRPSLFTLWLIPAAMLLAGLALAGAWAGLTSGRGAGPALPTATAIVTVLPLPSVTPPGASATPPPGTPPAPGEATPPPAPSGAPITVGSLVQVVGTGVRGLNLRSGPGLSQPVNLLALDSEVFRVDDGPREADGLTWWRLVDLQDPGRGGWAAASFLQVVQGSQVMAGAVRAGKALPANRRLFPLAPKSGMGYYRVHAGEGLRATSPLPRRGRLPARQGFPRGQSGPAGPGFRVRHP